MLKGISIRILCSFLLWPNISSMSFIHDLGLLEKQWYEHCLSFIISFFFLLDLSKLYFQDQKKQAFYNMDNTYSATRLLVSIFCCDEVDLTYSPYGIKTSKS